MVIPMEHSTDVMILGGGMNGLSLGIALARGGVDVVVIDRADPAAQADDAFDGRTSALAITAVRLFQAIGVWPHIAQSQPILDIRVTDGDSPLYLHYDHRDVGEAPFGYMVENRHIRCALLRAAEGLPRLHHWAPCPAPAIERGADAVTAHWPDGRALRARVILSAEGRQSSLREAAQIRTAAWDYDQVGIVCTVRHAGDHGGIAHERFFPAGPFAILPMAGGHHSSLVWTERADLAQAYLALNDAEFLREIAWRFGDFLGALSIKGPRWSYPLKFHLAERYVDHRLALVGDAAHGIHPIAGQGLNLGLRDVAALAEILIEGKRLGLDLGTAAVLEGYQVLRRFDGLLLGAVTDGLNRLFSNDIAPVRVARQLGLGLVQRLHGPKVFFMRHAMGEVGRLPKLLRGEAP